MSLSAGWWLEFFPEFRTVFDLISGDQSSSEADRLIDILGLSAGGSFLDCPSGIGRIAIPLARKGIRVTAVDIMPDYLQEIVHLSRAENLGIKISCTDMREVDFAEEFDAAANIWNSFGYFEDETDNRMVIANMYRALRPGGRFLLNVSNRDWVLASFQDREWFSTPTAKVLEQRKFDLLSSTLIATWTFIRNGQEQVLENRIRLYSAHELIHMFSDAGFKDIRTLGGFSDVPITRATRTISVVGVK